MRTVNVKQRSPEWHQWRQEGVSASHIPTLTGRNPYETPWQLWAQRVGLVPEPDLSRNPHVQRGQALEDTARQFLEAIGTGNAPEQASESLVREVPPGLTTLLPVCGEFEPWPVLRASFDGLTEPDGGSPNGRPVEIKVPGDRVWQDLLAYGRQSRAFRMYWAQIQAQMLVASASAGFLFFYHGDGPGEQMGFPVARDESFRVQELLPAAERFWKQLQSGEEPEQDPERDVYCPAGDDLYEWTAVSERYKRRYRQLKELEQQAKALKQELAEDQRALEALMGAFARAEANGVRVTRSHRRGAVDYRAALEAWVDYDPKDLETYRKAGSNQVSVLVRDQTAQPSSSPSAPTSNTDADAAMADEESTDEVWFY